MTTTNDTIAAISTPHGIGGVALIRIAGPDALPLTLRHITSPTLQPRRATYTHFTADGQQLDDIVATYYPAPHSYTGLDTVELCCHGSLYIQQTLLQTLIDSGARLAQPGEYSLRAFLNGKLNLSQTEAIADLIDATTPAQHQLAISQLRGGYAQQLTSLRQQLIDLTTLLELELDFSQEDIEFADRTQLHTLLDTLTHQIATLLDSFRLGNAIKNGIPVAITGQPNVGKSTLLNALLGDDRAIVSPIPGTTRDTIDGLLTIGSHTFRLIDTAGLRHTTDTIEQLGIERSQRAYNDALIVLHVVDATQPTPLADLTADKDKHHIIVLNKSDLATPTLNAPPDIPIVAISALNKTGLAALRQTLTDTITPSTTDNILLTNARHYQALLRVQNALAHTLDNLHLGLPADLLAVDLRDALYHLGTITGEITSDDILTNIFSRFCIGK